MLRKPQKTKRPPRKVDTAYLERAALYYLERYASSSANLCKILKRKIDRRCKLREEDPAEFYELIAPIVERYIASGLLNDEAYAQGQIASMRRRGNSKRAITAKLAVKGIKAEQVDVVLENDEIDELQAARNYVRRRRLGPWRTKELSEEDKAAQHMKDLATLGRAGFSFHHAKIVLSEDKDEIV